MVEMTSPARRAKYMVKWCGRLVRPGLKEREVASVDK